MIPFVLLTLLLFGNDLNVQLFYLSKTVRFWCQCAAEHVIVKRAAAFVRRRGGDQGEPAQC